MTRLWRRKFDDTKAHQFEIGIHLRYRIDALAQVIEIVTARHAIITGFSASGENHCLSCLVPVFDGLG